MLGPQQKSTGTRYTSTVALVTCALVFVPATLLAYSPFRLITLALAVGCSLVFLALAYFNWTRHSEHTIPSISTDSPRSK
jgi:hypothetical protein